MTPPDPSPAPSAHLDTRVRIPPFSSHTPAPWAGLDFAKLRASLRRRLDLPRRVIATGHQAEFFHPGVLAKSIVAAAVARTADADALFVWVDSDVTRNTSLVFAAQAGGRLSRAALPIPGLRRDVAVEALPDASIADWREFWHAISARALRAAETPIADCAAAFLTTSSLCDGLAAAQDAILRRLGIANPLRSVRVSQLAETPEFRALAAALVRTGSALALAYNAALEGARTAGKLLVDVERWEVPLWAFQRDGVRRRVVAVRGKNGIVLHALDGPVVGHCGESLEPADGWRIRPRALLLSAFFRLLLADVFIHGIGGEAYDRVTEAWLLRGTGIVLPPIGVASGTLHLPADSNPDAATATPPTDHQLRHNPQRYLPVSDDLARRRRELIAQCIELRTKQPRQRERRRSVRAQIRDVLDAILAAASADVAEIRRRRERLGAALRRRQVLEDRSYFYGLYLSKDLQRLADTLRTAAAPA
jgi:hypothetical protein